MENNFPAVLPVEVLQYLLGRVAHPARRAAIEATRPIFPELWEALTKANNGGQYAAMPLAPWIAGVVAADKNGRLPPNMPAYSISRTAKPGRISDEYAMIVRTAARAEASPAELPRRLQPVVEQPLPEPPFTGIKDGCLESVQRGEDIPFALARVFAINTADKPVYTQIVVMKYISGPPEVWSLKVPLTSLFGGDVPAGNLRYYVEPATVDSAALFPVQEVKRRLSFLASARTEERKRILDFITQLEAK